MRVLRDGRWDVALRSRGRLLLLCAAVLTAVSAHGSVTVLLEQPYGKLGFFEPAGHSAIYLDRVCAETPLVLRECRAGELGVVISRYDGIQHYDWVAMPLLPYLYSVNTAAAIPAAMNRDEEFAIRDDYRRRYLQIVAPDRADGGAPEGNWTQLLGSAFDRTIYGFRVRTTPEQDAGLIAMFNDRPNVERYNGFFTNCADFARVTVNRYYPHAVRRNFVADLGMTSPKAVARGLAHYAKKHPETDLQVFVIPQVKGDLPRSHANVDFTEGVVKRLGIALAVLSPVSAAAVLAAYVGQGRFAMPQDAPQLDFAGMEAEAGIQRPFPVNAPELALFQIESRPVVVRNSETALLAPSGAPAAKSATTKAPDAP